MSVPNPGIPGAYVPPGSLLQWQTAKRAAQKGTGLARLGFPMGDSITAGQSGNAPANADSLKYGYVGRLKTLLLQSMALSADGFTIGGCLPGTLNSPSSPYGNSALPAGSQPDGGIGVVNLPSGTGSTYVTVTMQQDYDTGAFPAAGPSGAFCDLLTVDFNTNQWSYAVDGGGATTVTGAGSGTVGQGIMRRTSISGLAGGQTHTVALTNVSANGLLLTGHVTYYGTTGLQIFRNGIPGLKAVDFAVGPGTTAGYTGSNSFSANKTDAWAGQATTGTPAGVVNGFPFSGLDLAIIMITGNDASYGADPEETRRSISRYIDAVRRANPGNASSSGYPCSVALVSNIWIDEYSDNSSVSNAVALGGIAKLKTILSALARDFNCAYLDLHTLLGETPVATGWGTSGQVHLNQQPALAATATPTNDGHLYVAQALTAMGV